MAKNSTRHTHTHTDTHDTDKALCLLSLTFGGNRVAGNSVQITVDPQSKSMEFQTTNRENINPEADVKSLDQLLGKDQLQSKLKEHCNVWETIS